MATTAIEWTDETWNPTTGCDRISPGCDNCYALTMAKRLKAMGQAKYQNDGDPRTSGPGFALTEHPDTLDAPLRWRKPRKVFVNSMSDLFHKDVSDEFIARVFAVMALTPQHTYQVLTKRPQRMSDLLGNDDFWEDVAAATVPFTQDIDEGELAAGDLYGRIGAEGPSIGLRNVWLGTSIESNAYCFRADHLRRTPAAIRFISAEPLIGALLNLRLDRIDWVIVGGESGGANSRPMHPDWARQIRDNCASTGTAFFFKQWGDWSPEPIDDEAERIRHDHVWLPSRLANGNQAEMFRIGKHDAGRTLDGRTWDEFPTPS